jgi:hypothetical protein
MWLEKIGKLDNFFWDFFFEKSDKKWQSVALFRNFIKSGKKAQRSVTRSYKDCADWLSCVLFEGLTTFGAVLETKTSTPPIITSMLSEQTCFSSRYAMEQQPSTARRVLYSCCCYYGTTNFVAEHGKN